MAIVNPFFEVCNAALSYMPYRWNHEPNVARMFNNELLAVWGATGSGPFRDTKVVCSLSSDNGRNWSSPADLASDPDFPAFIPSLLVTAEVVILQYSILQFGTKRGGDGQCFERVKVYRWR